jgi:hypothetical protein
MAEFVANNKVLIDIFGLCGSILSLLPYILLQIDKVEEDGFWYNFLNIIASIILIIYSILLAAWANILIFIVILGFAIRTLSKVLLKHK